MSDISIRIEGRAGRVTLARPQALNALTHAMCLAVEQALDGWRDDAAVALIVIDAAGDKAFCAGGDVADLYRTGLAGDYGYGQRFWRDEYRMNAKLANYPKPIISVMQGLTMGGGVGLGGHVSHRVVTDTSQMSMPECGIGLVPDVGGSLLLARSPGRLGAYLGLTAARMGPGDAIHAGFADLYLPQDRVAAVIAALCQTGDIAALLQTARPAPDSPLAALQPQIDRLFASDDLPALLATLRDADGDLATRALRAITRNAPLSMALALAMLARLRAPGTTIGAALELEYRVSHRIMEHGDFLEGIRAAIIDKDRNPRWKHDLDHVPQQAVAQMLAPLGPATLTLEKD